MLWAVNSYASNNIPIRPLMDNGDPDAKNLYTDQEKDRLAGRLTPAQLATVYDDPVNRKVFHPLKLLNYQIPRDFWDPDRIKRQNWHGVSLATGLTSIPALSDPTKVQLEVAFDIDCNSDKNDNPTPKQIAEKLIQELKLFGRTIIQRTPNGGLHVVICIPVDPNDAVTIKMWEDRGMTEDKCINNCRVAIKIKGGQISLDPTHHRTKTHLKYELLDRNLVIAECPEFYFRFIEELRNEGCIPEESKGYSYKSTERSNVGRYDFTDKEIEDATAIILGSDNGDFNSIFVEGLTNETTLGLGGYCYKRNASLHTTQAFVARVSNLSGDSKLSKRMSTIASTFQKADTSGRDSIKGSTVLIAQFKKAIKDQTKSDADKQVLADYRLSQLNDALNIASKSGLTAEQVEEMEDIRLASEQVSGKDIKFLFSHFEKYAPHDVIPTKQLFYGMSTTFTRCPMPHNVNSRAAGSGKNFLLELTSSKFPEKYVLNVTRISDKAMFHRDGILVVPRIDESGKTVVEPLSKLIAPLYARKKELREEILDEKEKKEKNKKLIRQKEAEMYELDEEIKSVSKGAQKYIDLNNQITVCLDTVPFGFLDMLMSLISQDTQADQIYEFAEKSNTGPMDSKKNRMHGVPNLFCARTTDESRSDRFEERNRRFIPVNPSTSAEKINTAMDRIVDRDSLLDFEFEESIGVSAEDEERCKSIVAHIVAKLKVNSRGLKHKDTNIRNVFSRSLKSALPKALPEEVWKMTTTPRVTWYLAIIAKINIDNRCVVEDNRGPIQRLWVIPNYADLKEALLLMTKGASAVRPYQADFYNETFLPLFKECEIQSDNSKSNYTITETTRGLTTQMLSDKIKEKDGRLIGKKELLDKFLYPLENVGVLSHAKSKIDGRENIFYPIEEESITGLFEDANDPRLKITDSNLYPSISLIEESCGTLMGYSSKRGLENGKKIRLLDPERNEIDIKTLVRKHLGNPKDCFIKGWLSEREREEERKIDTNNEKDIFYNKIVNTSKLFQSSKDSRKNIIREIHNNNLEQLTIPESFMGQRTLDLVEVTPKPYIQAGQLPVQPEVTLTPTVIPEILPFPKYLTEQIPQLSSVGYFDCEWDRSGAILCFCYIDSTNGATKLHVKDYAGRHAFMSVILDTIAKCKTLIGYAIFDNKNDNFISDMGHLESNCKQENLLDRYNSVIGAIEQIDLQKIFGNSNVRNFLNRSGEAKYPDTYKVSLEDVCQAYIQEGKTTGITGRNVEYKPPNEQLNYCLQDVVLTYKLVQKNNFELLGIINEIAVDIHETFFKTCNAGFPTSWIGPMFNSIELIKIYKTNEEVRKFIDDNMSYEGNTKKGVKYVGGYVKPPVMGRHIGAFEYDVNSMYPTIAKNNNISPETVNCGHEYCKIHGKVPDEVMKIINDYLLDPKNKKVRKHEARPWHYWICKLETGKFAERMQEYFDRKSEYKKQGLVRKEKATKIMANSSYGAFGNAYFEYQDPRCGELITAYGQYTIRRLENFAGEDNVLYIDTDGIYLRGENKDIIRYAKEELGVKLEEKKRELLFLTNNAKQIMSLTEDGTVENTTVTGMKSNYPKVINEIASNLISKEFLQPFITDPDTALNNVLQYVRDGFKRLTGEHPSNLSVSKVFEKDLWNHETNIEPKQLYNEILQDCDNNESLAKSQSVGGEVRKFWLVKAKNRSVSIHPERYQPNWEKYRSYLFNAIEPQLKVFGMTEEELEKLEKELVVK